MPVMDKERSAPSAEEIEKMHEKIKQNESENNVLRKQLDEFFDGKLPSHKVINVCGTPNILKILNSSARKVVINQTEIANAVSDRNSGEKGHTEGHEIGKEEMYKLADAIRNPIMVLKGNSRNQNSVLLITDMVNKNNQNVFVPISLDRQNGKVNIISSLYGKKNLSHYLSEHLQDVIAINTKKASLLADTENQYLQSINETVARFDDSIAYTTANVKYPAEELTENIQNNGKEENEMLTAESDFEKSEKLLPILDSKAEFHQNRINNINEKIARQSDKIARNHQKIDKLTAKADRLEDLNRILKETLGEMPLVKSVIENNTEKINAIRNERIPKRHEKINSHTEKVAALQEKKEIISHKLDRTVALSNTISSFSLSGSKRREAFRASLDALHKATVRCLNDKINALEIKQFEIGENTSGSNLEQLKAAQKMNDISRKINKLKSKITSYEEFDDDKTDKLIEHTAEIIGNSVDSDEISAASIAENIAVENVEFAQDQLGLNMDREELLSQREQIRQEIVSIKDVLNYPIFSGEARAEMENEISELNSKLNEIDNKLADMSEFIESENYLKNAEMAVEDDYNSIDGIINNGKRDEPAEMPKKDNSEKAVTMIDPDYYRSLPKDDRRIFTLSNDTAETLAKRLQDLQIPFSAVINKKSGKTKITVSHENENSVQNFINKSSEKYIDPDFYRSLDKSERFTQRMDEKSARDTLEELNRAGIRNSAVLNGDKSAVTISIGDYKKAKEAKISVSFLKERAAAKHKTPRKEPDKTQNKKRGVDI